MHLRGTTPCLAALSAVVSTVCASHVLLVQPDAPAPFVRRDAQDGRIERYVLDNGLRVVLMPVPDAPRVAVISMVDVGILDDPAGITQAAHLLEHVVCMGATTSYPRNEAFNLLNKRGVANAETMADWTRYEAILAAEDLELILTIEAQRLTSLQIDDEVIKQEAPRCHAEAVNVEMFAGAPMLKFAFMAGVQAWAHGAESAKVKSGLETTDPKVLADFHARHYQPDRMTLILVGGFDPASAKMLIQREFGKIHPRKGAGNAPRLQRIAWNDLPPVTEVRWDSLHTAVILTWAPPEDPLDQAVLSAYSNLLFAEVTSDAKILPVAAKVMASTTTWSIGCLPYFVYATLRPGQDPREAARTIAERVHALAAEAPSLQRAMHAKMAASQTARGLFPSSDAILGQARMLERQDPSMTGKALDMILGNLAIQACIRQRLIGHDESVAAALSDAVTPERLWRILTETITPDRLRVTILTPTP